MTLVRPCLIEADRAMSRPRVELWVGTMPRPARYTWDSLSTSIQRTGTEGMGVMPVMKRCWAGPIAYLPHISLWRTSLWCSRNTGSSLVNVTRTVG